MASSGSGPRIVIIGGGSGTSNVIRGLKQYTANLTAIVTMFDSGGSSGLLREEFGYPPFGDLRQCLMALGDDSPQTKTLCEALDFRFGQDSSLNGHSVGNLLLAALTTLNDDVERALDAISSFLGVTGDVVPVTLEKAELCAELEDGQIIRGESGIDLRDDAIPPIARLFLDREVDANPRAMEAILRADAIVLGPGDLYTSVIPNLLPEGICDAIAATPASRMYVCNLMTKMGETDSFKASDFVRELVRYMDGKHLDYAIVNSQAIPRDIQMKYEPEGAFPVEPDLETVQEYVSEVLWRPLANGRLPLRHDPVRTAKAIACHANRRSQSDGSRTGVQSLTRGIRP